MMPEDAFEFYFNQSNPGCSSATLSHLASLEQNSIYTNGGHHTIYPQSSRVVGNVMPVTTVGSSSLQTTPLSWHQPCPSSSVYLNTKPDATCWPGDYEFSIEFPECPENPAKSVPWTYSSTLTKLLANIDQPWPVTFVTRVAPPTGTVIRALLRLKNLEIAGEAIQRCPNHILRDKVSSPECKKHVLRCRARGVHYGQCLQTGHNCCSLEFWPTPKNGKYETVAPFTLNCFSSCSGSANRRETIVIFTLEHGDHVLGRQSVAVRCCACPGRDQGIEKKRAAATPNRTSSRTCSRVTSVPNSNASHPLTVANSSRPIDEGESESRGGSVVVKKKKKGNTDEDDVICGRQGGKKGPDKEGYYKVALRDGKKYAHLKLMLAAWEVISSSSSSSSSSESDGPNKKRRATTDNDSKRSDNEINDTTRYTLRRTVTWPKATCVRTAVIRKTPKGNR